MTNLESLTAALIDQGWFVRLHCTAKEIWAATLFRADYSDRVEGVGPTALDALLCAQRNAEKKAAMA